MADTVEALTARTDADASLPPELRALMDQLDENERHVQALVAELDEAQILWQPSPASWSIGQCLDHITVTNRVYLEPMSRAVALARERGPRRRGPIRPGAPSRWFIRTLEPPPHRRLPAPKKIVPSLGKTRTQLAAEFGREQQRVRDLLLSAAALDLNRTRFVNPLLPLLRFSVGTGLLVIAAHERRHLYQAAAVRRHPGFP
jgi:hypothetical protein